MDDEVWASLVLLAIVISLPKRRCFNIHMKLSCIAKFLHTVLYSIMMLHEGFLCAADEHMDIEVINLLSADGHSFTSFCSGIPRNSLSAMIILSLGMESLGSVGMALNHAPACFSMEESTILLFGGSSCCRAA